MLPYIMSNACCIDTNSQLKTTIMKNPFVKDDDNSLVIAAIALGALAAGTIVYLVATKKGFNFGKGIEDAAEGLHDKATEYLERKKKHLKKKTTGLHEIEEIVHHQ